MNRTSVITLAILSVIIIAVAAYAFFVNPERFGLREAEPSDAERSFTTEGTSPYTDIDGNPIALDDYLGQVLVVTSWASWCPDCEQLLPDLSDLASRYADEGVVILAINRAEPQTTAVAYLKSIDATDGVNLILDPEDRFYDSIRGFSMPETLVYDRTGRIIAQLRGRVSQEMISDHVAEALDGEG